MQDPISELTQEWLVRAEHDLRVARYLLTMSDPPPETVGFHAQQCVEKVLKAYLTAHRVPFQRRHDLNYLIDLCMPLDSDFEQLRAPVDELTPYAVEFRYPDGLPTVLLEPAAAAVDTAGQIYCFVLERLKKV